MSRLIDADALQRAISVLHTMADDCGLKTGYKICMRLVDEQPTIEPERKKGKWIKGTITWHFRCSECAQSFEVDTVLGEPMWHFCPWCGSDNWSEQNG